MTERRADPPARGGLPEARTPRIERRDALVGKPHVQLIVQRAHVGDDEVGIDAARLFAQPGHDLARVALDACVDIDVSLRCALAVASQTLSLRSAQALTS